MRYRGKQVLSIVFMLALCLSIVPAAFSQGMGMGGSMGQGGMMGPGGHHGMMYSVTVKGTVVSVDTTDPAASTLTVKVSHASHAQNNLVDQDITFTVDPKAIIMEMGVGMVSLDNILPDDVVKIMGSNTQNGYVAYRIMVY